MPEDRWRQAYCVAMGAFVQPVVMGIEVGRPVAAFLFVVFTVWPWVIVALLPRTASAIAAGLLTLAVVLNAIVLPSEDSAGRAIGWASVSIATWWIAVGAFGLSVLAQPLKRR